MAFSLNRVQLIGNVTKDPEVRQTPTGQSVATFSVATNLTWTDQSGQRQTKTDFHNLVAWRKLAEIIGQYVKKGSKIYVEGRLQNRDWEGPDGQKRYRTEIVLENMIMLDSRSGDRGGMGGEAGAYASSGAGAAGAGMGAAAIGSAPRQTSSMAGSKKRQSDSDEIAAAPEPTEDEVTIDDLPF